MLKIILYQLVCELWLIQIITQNAWNGRIGKLYVW